MPTPAAKTRRFNPLVLLTALLTIAASAITISPRASAEPTTEPRATAAAESRLVPAPPFPAPGETRTISGRVLDERTGEPIAGASVHASRSVVFATTGADGRFVLTDAPESSALVIAGKEGYAFSSTTVADSVELRLGPDDDPARAEYPRPDADRRPFTDDAWLTLNGTWSFDFDPEDVGQDRGWYEPDHEFSKAIRVPYGYQSLAAWGEESLATNEVFRSAFGDYRGAVWYRRSFTVPEDFSGSQVRLRIGAADWGAAVWLDGESVLSESGDGFTEIDAGLGALDPGSEHTITIRVVAPPTTPDSPYPMGKQTGRPDGERTSWFSDIGGIWQSVWIEPYGQERITQATVTPQLTFEGDARTPSSASAKVEVRATGGSVARVRIRDPRGRIAGVAAVRLTDGHGTAEIPIRDPHLWEPDDPALYTAEVRLGSEDGLDTTFGMRTIGRDWAPGHDGEYQYVYLNNRPIYIRGVLDHAYNPWGVYTYTGVTAGPDLQTGTEADPGRGSILYDLKHAKDLGFNVVRTHVKVNEPAYYHWADKLGVMIWYDMPNAGWLSMGEQAEDLYQELLTNSIIRDQNHPSIVIWTTFNEAWGISEDPWGQPIPVEWRGYVRRMVDLTRSLDPSRLVIDNSACCQNGHLDTDLNDFHYYLATYTQWKNLLDRFGAQVEPSSSWNFNEGKQSGQPWLNSEFSIKGGRFPHTAGLFRSYPKLNGYVGVQLMGTEQETTGPFSFDRQPRSPEFVDHEGNPRTLAMFQGDDTVSLVGESTRTVERGEAITTPVTLSHFSDRDLSDATLHWRVGGYDDQGRWIGDVVSGSRPVDPQRYTVTDAGTVSVAAPEALRTGQLWVWIEADGQTVAESYLTYDTTAGHTEGAAFSPSAPVAHSWTGGQRAQTKAGTDSVTGLGRGWFEYRVEVPSQIRDGSATEATLIAEVASAQSDGWYDSNNETAARRHPTTMTASVDGTAVRSLVLPDDPHGSSALAGRSVGSMSAGFGNRYGYRVAIPITAEQVGDAETIVLRLSSDGGGLSIFGAGTGRHGSPPRLVPGSVEVPDERPDAVAVDTRLSIRQAPAVISPADGTGTAIVSVVNDTDATVRDITVGVAAPEGWTATIDDSPTIAALRPGEGRHVAVQLRTDQQLEAGQTAILTATASWSGRAIQSIARSTVAFDPAAWPVADVDDTFDRDTSGDYTVVTPSAKEGKPELSFADGKLSASGDGAFYALLAHQKGPQTPHAVMIIDHGQWANSGAGQDALFNGLVKDKDNYIVAWTSRKGQHGIDYRINGKFSNTCCANGSLAPGDRWAFVLDGTAISIWVHRGFGWTKVHSGSIDGKIDFGEPGALTGWHYAAGFRGNDGTQAITRFEARSAPS